MKNLREREKLGILPMNIMITKISWKIGWISWVVNIIIKKHFQIYNLITLRSHISFTIYPFYITIMILLIYLDFELRTCWFYMIFDFLIFIFREQLLAKFPISHTALFNIYRWIGTSEVLSFIQVKFGSVPLVNNDYQYDQFRMFFILWSNIVFIA